MACYDLSVYGHKFDYIVAAKPQAKTSAASMDAVEMKKLAALSDAPNGKDFANANNSDLAPGTPAYNALKPGMQRALDQEAKKLGKQVQQAAAKFHQNVILGKGAKAQAIGKLLGRGGDRGTEEERAIVLDSQA
jgi:hypothetical protein